MASITGTHPTHWPPAAELDLDLSQQKKERTKLLSSSASERICNTSCFHAVVVFPPQGFPQTGEMDSIHVAMVIW